MKTTNTWLICGVMRICAHLRTFYASRTTNTLSQHSKQSKKACFLSQERNWHVEVRVYFPKLANICLHKSTSTKLYPFSETDKYLLQKIREDIVGGPSIVFTRKVVVDETFIGNLGHNCKLIVGIDASQLCHYTMCQPMPTGLYTRWEYDTESNKSKR